MTSLAFPVSYNIYELVVSLYSAVHKSCSIENCCRNSWCYQHSWLFQCPFRLKHDSEPYHRAKMVTNWNWKCQNNIRTLTLPAQSQVMDAIRGATRNLSWGCSTFFGQGPPSPRFLCSPFSSLLQH